MHPSSLGAPHSLAVLHVTPIRERQNIQHAQSLHKALGKGVVLGTLSEILES